MYGRAGFTLLRHRILSTNPNFRDLEQVNPE